MKIIRDPSYHRRFKKEFCEKYLEIYNKELEEFIKINKTKPSWLKKLQLQYAANRKALKELKLPSRKTIE